MDHEYFQSIIRVFSSLIGRDEVIDLQCCTEIDLVRRQYYFVTTLLIIEFLPYHNLSHQIDGSLNDSILIFL